MSIEVSSVTRSFGDFVALEKVSFSVPTGELVAFLGPSGSGKTTLLRIIAGLDRPDSGVVRFNGDDAAGLSLRERRVGFVFQHYALFRHMTVFENIAFGLRVLPRKARPPRSEIRERVMSLLSLVQLGCLADRHPSQLSGGQRQRVALARALAVEPRVLLLDEPFGALDARVRKELRRWLRRLHDEINLTSVFVTHDQEEALEVADRVVVLNEGRVEQIGSPCEVYDQPASPFVCAFLGNVNLVHGQVHRGNLMIGDIELNDSGSQAPQNAPVAAYVRPHDIEIERTRNGKPVMEGVVQRVCFAGPVVHMELLYRHGDGHERIEAELTTARYRELNLRSGERVFFRFRDHRVFTEAQG